MAEQPGLCGTWSETPKTGFLTTRHILHRHINVMPLLCVSAAPTNFGLLQRLQEKWHQQVADETRGDFLSTYSTCYDGFNSGDMTKIRHAIPREQSTTLHPINKINKDLHFRGVTAYKSPEKLPEMPMRSMTEVAL